MDEIRRLLNDIIFRIEKLEKGQIINKITIPADTTGYLIIKVVSSDPVSPVTNEIWINTTDKKLKWRDGGTTRYITFT